MKKLVVFLLLGGLVFGACKKGDNDPFISLKTRKARLSGEWKVTFMERTLNDTLFMFDGTTETKSFGGTTLGTYTVDYKMEFTKQGKYTVNRNVTYPENYFQDGTPALTFKNFEEGIWNFTGGAGDTRNKSQLLLQPEREEQQLDGLSNIRITVHTNPIHGRTINLDMLKDKSMRWKYDTETNSPTSIDKDVLTMEFEKI
ncbi:hypothetical protein KFE98_12225 [bacterium SCSIO 12741]|nr:hypothetical protein KFE98_12225 [bacterium SCSIO 12741]